MKTKRWSKAEATDGSLKLPLPNKFAAKASPLLPAGKGVCGSDAPPATTLWKRSDYARALTVPRVPKTASIALFRFGEPSTAVGCKGPSFCGALMQSLNHDAYDAHLAGLSFTVDRASRLEVRVSGFDASSERAGWLRSA